MYRELQPDLIVTTTERLGRRIAERFPGSGLSRVAQELLVVARETEPRINRLRRPLWPVRIAVVLLLALLVVAAGVAVSAVSVKLDAPALGDFLQGIEAAVNDVVFLAVGAYFLATVETRVKRKTALAALHELRSIAHIIDMHQLTKDPENVLSPRQATESSPRRAMSRFELARYLDYCSESLSITSKLAALYVQYFNDSVVLDSVNDVQTLAQGLSGKIWQKIMILDTCVPREGAAE